MREKPRDELGVSKLSPARWEKEFRYYLDPPFVAPRACGRHPPRLFAGVAGAAGAGGFAVTEAGGGGGGSTGGGAAGVPETGLPFGKMSAGVSPWGASPS